MPAKDVVVEQGGKLSPLSVKVAPELKDLMSAFRKETGKRPSEIVALALTEFFDGYEVPVVAEESEDFDEI